MKLIRRLFIVAMLALTAAPVVTLRGQQPQPPQQQDEFVPAESLPQREQVPAAPLLIGAYAFVLLALFGYVFSVARRLGAVQADIGRLESEMKRGSRA